MQWSFFCLLLPWTLVCGVDVQGVYSNIASGRSLGPQSGLQRRTTPSKRKTSTRLSKPAGRSSFMTLQQPASPQDIFRTGHSESRTSSPRSQGGPAIPHSLIRQFSNHNLDSDGDTSGRLGSPNRSAISRNSDAASHEAQGRAPVSSSRQQLPTEDTINRSGKTPRHLRSSASSRRTNLQTPASRHQRAHTPYPMNLNRRPTDRTSSRHGMRHTILRTPILEESDHRFPSPSSDPGPGSSLERMEE